MIATSSLRIVMDAGPLSKDDLLDRVLSGARRIGWHQVLLKNDHPFEVMLTKGDESLRLRIYVWRVTGGGRPQLPNEFRIQITTPVVVEPPPGFSSLVLGWFEEAGVIAAFDPIPRAERGAQSQSVQIELETLQGAAAGHLSVEQRTANEIAVAFPPEILPTYAREQARIHQFTADEEVSALSEAGAGDQKAGEETVADQARRVVLQTVARRVRSASFRSRVLAAYEGACTICGLQMELVEAAHVVPVAVPEGTDETSNGLALCPLHHRAYDAGLIGIAPDYRVVLNAARMDLLRQRGLAGGEESLLARVGKLIVLPKEEGARPKSEYLAHALTLRGW